MYCEVQFVCSPILLVWMLATMRRHHIAMHCQYLVGDYLPALILSTLMSPVETEPVNGVHTGKFHFSRFADTDGQYAK